MGELTADEKRGMLLTALDEKGGSAPTPELRKKTGISGNNLWNLMKDLRDDDLATLDGKERGDGNQMDPNIYRLTEMGEAAATRVQQEDGSLSEQIRKEIDVFADLQEVVNLQGTRIDDLEAEQEEMKDKWNGLIDHLDQQGVIDLEDDDPDQGDEVL